MRQFTLRFAMIFSLLIPAAFSKTINLNTNNTIYFRGPIEFMAMFVVIPKLAELNAIKTNEPIYLVLDSPGGLVSIGQTIVNVAKHSRRPVHTITIFAASQAFNIVQQLGRRYITNGGILLTHPVYVPRFDVTDTTTVDAQKLVDEIFDLYQIVAQRVGMTMQEYMAFMKKQIFVQGKNNLKLNLADEIVATSCSVDLVVSGGCPVNLL